MSFGLLGVLLPRRPCLDHAQVAAGQAHVARSFERDVAQEPISVLQFHGLKLTPEASPECFSTLQTARPWPRQRRQSQ